MPKQKKKQRGSLPSKTGTVDIRNLIVFRQTRDGAGEQYNDIPELARGIAANGLYHNLIACNWDREGMRAYVEAVARIPGQRNYDVAAEMRKIRASKDGRYLVLIAGHRRRQAIELILAKGSKLVGDLTHISGTSFAGKNGEECYDVVFPDQVAVKVYRDISASRALAIQFDENLNRDEVPPHVQAKAIQVLYYIERDRLEDKRLTIKQFSTDKGLSERVVREAIGFRELLPDSIIRAVEKGKFKWGCAIELTQIARLLANKPKQDGAMRTQKEIDFELTRLAATEAAASSVMAFKAYLRTWKNEVLGQLVMFEELRLTAEQISSNVLSKEAVAQAQQFISFIHKVEYAKENGWIREGTLLPAHTLEARRAFAMALEAVLALRDTFDGIISGDELRLLEEVASSSLRDLRRIQRAAGDKIPAAV